MTLPGLRIIQILFFSLTISIPLFAQNAVLIQHSTNISIKNNTLTKEVSYEILINNTKGEENTEVSIPYNQLQRISDIEATISDISGKIISKLKTSDIKKRSLVTDDAFFMDAMMIEFSLHHFSFPYIFRYSYKEEASEFLYIDNWYPFVSPDIATKNAELTVTIPKKYGISINNFKMDNPVITDTENSTEYKWKTSFKSIPETEEQMPDPGCFLPRVSIVPKNFRYKTPGSFESWKTYGQWQYEINEKLKSFYDADKEEIRELTKNIPDTIEKIRTLYHRLQDQTRYVNISLKTGGMIPVAAHLVSETKYGDCKGLTNYFKNVLYYAGIKSVYTDVNAGKTISPVDISFPSQQFNHVILCVPLRSDTIWLDCTSKGPFGYLGTFCQNRPVLLNENQQSAIHYTRALGISDVLSERNFLISNDSTGRNLITAKCTYRGEDFEKLLYFSKLSDFQSNKLTAQYYGLKNAEVEKYKITHTDRDDRKINLEFSGKSDKYVQQIGNDILLHAIAFNLPSFRKPSQRKYPVKFDYPLHLKDIQVTEIKTEVPAINQFPDVLIETPFGRYVKKVKFNKDSIEIFKELIINPGMYSLKEYPDFYDFIEKIKENENNAIVISPTH